MVGCRMAGKAGWLDRSRGDPAGLPRGMQTTLYAGAGLSLAGGTGRIGRVAIFRMEWMDP